LAGLAKRDGLETLKYVPVSIHKSGGVLLGKEAIRKDLIQIIKTMEKKMVSMLRS